MRDRLKLHPKVSVVIPMYNCEQFVPDLLKMFSEQSFTDFEVICVIDGATDGTEEVVKEYCKTDDRFRYVVRDNGGAGAARNTGIDEAKGKYIIFPDADDLYSKDYLLKLYNASEAQNADIAICSTVTIDYRTGEKRNIRSFNKTELLEGEIYSSKKTKRIIKMIDIHISNKMILLDLIRNEKLRFSETPATNDLFFSKAILACAQSIVVVHDDMITIRRHINAGSISSNREKNSHIALMEVQKLYGWMEGKGILGRFISDYLYLFDITANYEMKNGINHLFANEMARILNVDEPWNKLNGDQIKRILTRSLGEKGCEEIKEAEKNASYDELEKLDLCNKIAGERNESKMRMQEMVKKASLEKFGRDFDDPDSEAPCQTLEKTGSSAPYVSMSQKEKNSELTNKTPEISVIIPMYNCEKFVRDVLNMFSCQIFTDFEVICVIDGATDRTEEFVKEYCEKDRHFSYIYKQNGGPGSARNAGLDIARGRYIVFSDADDEYSDDYLKKLYETAVKHDAQITNCMFYRCDTLIPGNKTELGFERKFFEEGIVYSHSGIDNLFGVIQSRVTNKMFNAAFLKDNNIRFPETRVSEDVYFSYAGLSIADRIIFTRDSLLKYRVHINPDSLRDNTRRYIHEVPGVLCSFYVWLKDHDLLEIHGVDFFKRVNDSILFYGAFGPTPRFISEVAHMINAEEPWNTMSVGEVLTYLKESILANDAIKKEAELSAKIKPGNSVEETEINYKLHQLKHRIHTAELLRKVSMERYGRNFENILKVSVIIPVFNPGTGIIRCIDSLRNQTLHEIEILIIDDCSTDDSMDKVRKVATEDKRIHILKNEKNMGPGYSRNKGIEMAQGEYLSFVDPDDYVALDYLKLLYMKAKNEKTDIVKGLTICEKKDGSPLWERPMANQFLRDKLAKGVPLYAAFTRGHQNTIYRRSYILSKNVRYSLDYRAEDVVFLLQCCSRTNSITFSDEAFYYYCERYNSITHSTGSKELRYYFDSFHKLVEYAMQYLPENEYTKEYIQTLFLSAIRELYRYTDIQEMEKEVIYGLAYLREEWNRLPHHDEWGREFFSLYANQVYNRLLPMQPYFSAWEGARPPVRYALLLKRWVDFYIDMPQERKAVSKDLQKLIIKSIDAVSDSNKDYSTEEKKYGKAILVEQIKRLPLDMQSKIEDVRIKYHDWFYPKKLPKTIRIDASTHCQLCCAGCGIQKNNAFGLGKGFLKFENFKHFLDDNPQIERVELSNNGEIFLNPDLIKIMEYSYQKGVALEADMGTNFNTVSDEQLQALVDYEFRFISFSIDGASQETYSQYRRGGDYDKVIANIKKLINIKTKKGSHYPEMRWQFVPNEFNEGEIEQAKGLAKELGIPIWFKLNYLGNYKPSNPELLKAQTGLSEITRAEYLEKYELPYLNEDCLQVFFDPQFNWDGMFLGCCRSWEHVFKPNLFEDGLEACINSEDVRRLKEFLLLHDPDPEYYKDLPCWNCNLWKQRQIFGKVLELPSPDSV